MDKHKLTTILELDIPEINKAKHFVKIYLAHTELYESITDMLMESGNSGVLTYFLNEIESNKRIKRKIGYSSGSDWTRIQLKFFALDFEDVDKPEDICVSSELSDHAKKFMEDNNDLDLSITFVQEEQIGSVLNTAFKGHVLYTLKSPSIESCVDDMMSHLLEKTLGPKFLIKTKYDTKLIMSEHDTKATADVLAVFLPKMYMGIIIVEDKPNTTSKTVIDHKNAEAQLIAEAIAIAQQKRWPENTPIFMLRVLETSVTFYKAIFNKEVLNAVEKGLERLEPFIIKRLKPNNYIFTNDRPGYNILKRDERNIVIKLLNDIGIYITQMFS